LLTRRGFEAHPRRRGPGPAAAEQTTPGRDHRLLGRPGRRHQSVREPIFYGGAKLATDLSLTRLRARWQPDTTLAGSDRRARQLRPVPAEIYQRAAALIAATADHVRAHGGNPSAVVGTVAAAADVLAATAAAWEGTAGGPLTRAAELSERAAHEPTRVKPARPGARGYPLRAVARLVATTATSSAARGQRELARMSRSGARSLPAPCGRAGSPIVRLSVYEPPSYEPWPAIELPPHLDFLQQP